MSTMIRVDDLGVRFGRFEAARGVSFAVEKGASFGIVGESGSGKSTVLRALSGLNQDWSGKMEIGGVALGPRRPKDFFRRVQMVFQDPYGSLHPRQTVDRALSEPLEVHGIADPEPRILRALAEVALPAAVRFRYPHQLSGGQRQRVAVARALDVSVQAEVLNLLMDLQERRNLTYVMVSHNLAVVAHLCSTVGVMQGGEMVETVTSADLRAGRASHPHTRELRALSMELEEP
jgi:peptide/nickel transport system ATP-binding protein